MNRYIMQKSDKILKPRTTCPVCHGDGVIWSEDDLITCYGCKGTGEYRES